VEPHYLPSPVFHLLAGGEVQEDWKRISPDRYCRDYRTENAASDALARAVALLVREWE
jgi:hypothetical protein